MAIKFPFKCTAQNKWGDPKFLKPELATWGDKPTWSADLDDPMGVSSLNNARNGKAAMLNSHIANACYEFTKGENASFTLCKIAGGDYSVEAPMGANTYLIANVTSNGHMYAAVVNPVRDEATGIGAWGQASVVNDNIPQEAIWALFMMCGAQNDAQADQMLDWLKTPNTSIDWTQPQAMVYRFCDAVFQSSRLDKYETMHDGGGNIPFLNPDVIKSSALYGTVLCGPEPQVLIGDNPTVTASLGKDTIGYLKETVKELRAGRHWTEAERMLIPEFSDDTPVLPEVSEIVRMYVGSTGMVRPMRNFLWRGITSYGKSTGCEMVACILDMPYVTMECSPTMTSEDFKVRIVPDTSSPIRQISSVPSFVEIECDPVGAYKKLTGEDKADATGQDCMDAYAEMLMASGHSGGQMKLKYEDSEFVKAVRNGWFVEIQEPSTIRDAGVLAGINKIDRPGATMALLDGSYVRRHANTIVAYTDNVSYAGCRPLNQSVIRRNALVFDSYTLEKDQVLDRIKRNTGFANDKLLDDMYNVWDRICTLCKEKDITDGSTSATELEMWCQAVMIDGYKRRKEHCRNAVISKASSNIDDQEELWTAISTLLSD